MELPAVVKLARINFRLCNRIEGRVGADPHGLRCGNEAFPGRTTLSRDSPTLEVSHLATEREDRVARRGAVCA